jgi:hypothetical protein
MSQNAGQQSVNDFCAGIFDNITRKERRKTKMNLSAAIIGKNAGVKIPSASENSTHAVSRLRTLHSNKLQYTVPEWSSTWSVVAICPCI